ncbi:bifunctional 2',3'-cyclic-nucleotide 2'-phosphodiesterase/3'-nucleotidase [Paracoccus ravus]|uniref:bifunctional 2',3'-cyclic-nucleotide 2'-phosphodiesterase/3'-nucleotidase n=1 Tax=Paracoccus ravus TaxID=2447760 RepID=UPI00106E9240|nr:bifunctional 2',3'-cyclic-nucleotide 2'-phosphodiesterase/3'-nucleotidase [Paracoccus ravus]
MSIPQVPDASGQETTVELTVIATSDLHVHVLGFDYFRNRKSGNFGFARLASAIAAIRATSANCLVLDNGDLLQGNPLGDYLAEKGWDEGALHPLIAAMNHAGYDAATIGNHDFSHGIAHLRKALEGAAHPVVSTNLVGGDLPILPHLMLRRHLTDSRGCRHEIRIGILGFLPPQTTEWEPELQGRIRIDDILGSAQRGIATLKREGADLIIALAHSGIGAPDPVPGMENAATALAALPGIDLIVAGHTHRLFPAAEHPDGPGIDPLRGTLAGKPCVMPGFWGSHLGVFRLKLKPAQTALHRWQISAFHASLEPAAGHDEDRAVRRLAVSAHRGTLRHLRQPIGLTATRMHSFFTALGHDAGLALVCEAQRRHVRALLHGSRWAGMPILSAASAFRSGGRGGPEHYTDIPPGPLCLRGLSDLYVFPNRVCAVRIDGRALSLWLEISASMFRQITPGRDDQDLLDPDFPSYNFDLISGLTYEIDLSAAPRHAPDGKLIAPGSRRVHGLRYRGMPVAPDDAFVLATNSYRLSANGVFASVTTDCPLLLDGGMRSRDALRRHVESPEGVAPLPDLGLRFRPLGGTGLRFQTSPRAVTEIDALPFPARTLGLQKNGFLQLRLTL